MPKKRGVCKSDHGFEPFGQKKRQDQFQGVRQQVGKAPKEEIYRGESAVPQPAAEVATQKTGTKGGDFDTCAAA